MENFLVGAGRGRLRRRDEMGRPLLTRTFYGREYFAASGRRALQGRITGTRRTTGEHQGRRVLSG